MAKTYSWREMCSGLKDIPKVVLKVGNKHLSLRPEKALARIKAGYPDREVQWVVVGDRRAETFRIDVTETRRQGFRARERFSIRCPFSSK